ncbi:EAL domain-containing protein (putative c-di-GMP-specific phosphodiesterase class I) [Arthrobacter sp. CG_A4]|nr:EAL domain-containing protein (putative c-di-GMP-specific phosphodiesterase class I) [Arthrobacter sp. CG_A4]
MLLDPVLSEAASGPASLATTGAYAYPLGDVLLVAMITGMASAPKLGFGPGWMVLSIGLSTYADTDLGYALLSQQGTYASGYVLDVGWAIGVMLVACWADGASRVEVRLAAPASQVLPVSVPMLAVAVGLGALLLGTRMTLSTPAVVLAAATVAAAAVPLTFRAAAVGIALRVRAALAAPFALPGIGLQTSASIGVALAPGHGRDLSVLLSKADIAMYKAKESRSGHHVYTVGDDGHGDARLRTLEELRLALSDDQLLLHYQPKVQFGSDEVAGVEALVRWQHPVRGLVYPDSFLPLVEDAGLMHELTRVVLTKALDQALVWQERGHPLTIAVNLSVSSLVDTDLPTRIAAMIANRGLPASVLMLEITESFFMTDRARALDILTRLRDAGIQISIDDFGTGYSSLAYLRDLPIDELKLDRSFVLPMAEDTRAAALVASTIDLAHKLDCGLSRRESRTRPR